MHKIKRFLLSCMAVGLIFSQFNLPIGHAMRAINAQTEANPSQMNTPENSESYEASDSSSDNPPEPPKDFDPPVDSSAVTPSDSPEETSADETNSSESLIESSESSSDETSNESESSESSSESTSQTSSQEESKDSTPDETPVQNILPGSLMIKPMNMLEPVNVPTTVRRIINYYGNVTKKLFRVMVPLGQLLIFPYEGQVVSDFNLTLVDYFEDILKTITN